MLSLWSQIMLSAMDTRLLRRWGDSHDEILFQKLFEDAKKRGHLSGYNCACFANNVVWNQ
jgi:hypothetical protein